MQHSGLLYEDTFLRVNTFLYAKLYLRYGYLPWVKNMIMSKWNYPEPELLPIRKLLHMYNLHFYTGYIFPFVLQFPISLDHYYQ